MPATKSVRDLAPSDDYHGISNLFKFTETDLHLNFHWHPVVETSQELVAEKRAALNKEAGEGSD